jgi:hypothetical protein
MIPTINTVAECWGSFPSMVPLMAAIGEIKKIILKTNLPILVFGMYNSSPINVATGKFQKGSVCTKTKPRIMSISVKGKK